MDFRFNWIESKFLNWSELNWTQYFLSFGFNMINVFVEISIELNMVELNQIQFNTNWLNSNQFELNLFS
jgi:hypothetical protein